MTPAAGVLPCNAGSCSRLTPLPLRRRTYQTFLPDPRLRTYVAAYLVEERAGTLTASQPFRIWPDGSAYLLFRVYGAHGAEGLQARDVDACAFQFIGARSIYKPTNLRRRALTMLVQFHPGGAAPFFGLPAPDLTDQSCSAVALWGDGGLRLFATLAHTAGVRNRLRVLEAALLARLPQAYPCDPLVAHIVRQTQQTHGKASVAAMTAALGLSERQLRNRFAPSVGLTPKRLARIVRLEQTLTLGDAQPQLAGAELAHLGGYFDQAHLSRDFRTLLGTTPAAWLADA